VDRGLAAQQVLPRSSGYIVAGTVAKQQMEAEAKPKTDTGPESGSIGETGAAAGIADGTAGATKGSGPKATSDGHALPGSFYGKFSLDAVRAIRQLEDILQNVVEHLSGVEGGNVELTLEVNAKSSGYDDRIQRVVNENAGQLGAAGHEFE
jgi:hypothetical protein